MATVWLARDLRYDRPVALKVLRPELAASLGSERFLREIMLAARLQHPHVVSVYDSGEIHPSGSDGSILWFTMPYIEGESLRERLRREGSLAPAEALRIAREVARGLQYAHDQGVIHRDVKPENILLTRDGSTLVADFGIARASDTSASNLTGTGIVVGTPVYMSPEQATGADNLDARTDVYALGCVLYEMLTGEPPFIGPNAQSVALKHMAQQPVLSGCPRRAPSRRRPAGSGAGARQGPRRHLAHQAHRRSGAGHQPVLLTGRRPHRVRLRPQWTLRGLAHESRRLRPTATRLGGLLGAHSALDQ